MGSVANGPTTSQQAETCDLLPSCQHHRANDTEPAPELKAPAEHHGWEVACIFEDAGVSGAKGRRDRPGLDALLKAVARREIDLVAVWSVDRLGRSLTDLLDVLRELREKGVDPFLHQ
jgi:DNA invertase Pin-like site-specific DNA recombinase